LRLGGVSTVRITVYGRAGCHLCEEMRDVAAAIARETGATFDEVDVDADPAIAAMYDLEVPVLCVDGVKAFSIRVTPALLRERVRREMR
jgi:glutaredoxin